MYDLLKIYEILNVNEKFSISMVKNHKNLKQKKRLVKVNHKSDKIFLAPGTMTL